MTSASRPVPFIDANVLYSAGVRDILLQLGKQQIIVPKWSEDIGVEWQRALRNSRPSIPPEKLDRIWEELNYHYSTSLVTGYDHLINDIHLPDPDDRHVLAAATVGNCDVILTANLRDFPQEAVGAYGLSAEHPDSWMRNLLESKPDDFCRAVRDMRRRLRKPPFTVAQHLESLERQGLKDTVSLLRQYAHLLE
ncbi:MAG: PIN domain-containing protein [Chloroflexi bacterium]|nr:PIN domain-containing protein [Chloroflexota bacterium]